MVLTTGLAALRIVMVALLLVLPLILLVWVCAVALRYVVVDGRLRRHVLLILMSISGLMCAVPMARADALVVLRSQFRH